jgi:hypothetical protein
MSDAAKAAALDGNGPAVDYFRVDEGLWGRFDLVPDMAALTLRLGNRWQYYTSRYETPAFRDQGNNPERDDTAWTFPDEIYVDNLYLDLDKVFDSNLSFRIGRQNVILGNGMVLLEGTTYDQDRSMYFDGIVATYENESDTLKLLALYNTYKDSKTSFEIVDQERSTYRRLRRGDQWVLGPYWTHRFMPAINTDLYYLYVDVNDDYPAAAEPIERNHDWLDENARLNIVGARAFGDPHELIGYSLEAAHEFGSRSTQNVDFSGNMADLRLIFRSPKGTVLSPQLTLQYLYLSGDDTGSAGEFEGWHPAFAEYAMWREELLANLFNANWTNMNQYRTTLDIVLLEGLTLRGSWAYLQADDGRVPVGAAGAGGAGAGDDIGHVISGFLDYALNANVSFAIEAAEFFPGNYFADGHNCEWLRVQTMVRF